MYIFLFLTGRRETGTKQDSFLQIFISRVNLDPFWARDPSTTNRSYIHFRENIVIWKKLGIDPKIVFPVLGPLPMKEYVCGCGVAINMVSKSLYEVRYGV